VGEQGPDLKLDQPMRLMIQWGPFGSRICCLGNKAVLGSYDIQHAANCQPNAMVCLACLALYVLPAPACAFGPLPTPKVSADKPNPCFRSTLILPMSLAPSCGVGTGGQVKGSTTTSWALTRFWHL
jgi:hypothetical protein